MVKKNDEKRAAKEIIKAKAQQIKMERQNQQKFGQGKFIKDPTKLISKHTVDAYTLIEKTQFIEEAAQFVITQPELYIGHLQSLIHLLSNDSLIIVKLACFSLVEIFKDITPSYKIDVHAHKQKLTTSVKKEEREVLQFELKLNEFYDKYIDVLFEFSRTRNQQERQIEFQKNSKKNNKKNKKQKNQNKQKDENEDKQAEEPTKQSPLMAEINVMALKCLAELIGTLYHFNNALKIASKIIFALLSENENIHKLASEKIKTILGDKNHSLYELKQHILKEMGKILRARPEKDTPDDFIDLINVTEIDTAHLKKDVEEDEKKKRMQQKMDKRKFFLEMEKAKKEGKKFKNNKGEAVSVKGKKSKNMTKEEVQAQRAIRKELQSELDEGIAEMTPQQIIKNNTDILEKLFYIYFRLVKQETISKFFNSVMNGILRFVHLINVDLIWALVKNLYVCSVSLRNQSKKDKNMHNLQRRLACIFTVEEIIQGPGIALEMDDQQAQIHFYQILVDMNLYFNEKKGVQKNIEFFQKKEQILMIRILEKMFLKKRQFCYETVASFMKNIVLFISTQHNLLAVQTQSLPTVITLLFTVKLMLQKYPKVNRMLDDENYGYGLDMYNQKIEEPQSTNAINTTIIDELNQMSKDYSKTPEITNLIGRIIRQEPLIASITSLKPIEFYEKIRNLK